MKKIIVSILVIALSFTISYADTKENSSKWAKEYIEKAVEKGIIGLKESDYKLEISRKEFCKLLVNDYYRNCNYNDFESFVDDKFSEKLLSYKYNFEDLDYNDKEDMYVVYANLLGFVRGRTETRFYPNDKIKRKEIARPLLALYNQLLLDKNVVFDGKMSIEKFSDDDKIRKAVKKPLYTLKGLDILHGSRHNKFNPNNTFSKQEAIASIVKLNESYNNLIKNADSLCKSEQSTKIKGSVKSSDGEIFSQVDVTYELENAIAEENNTETQELSDFEKSIPKYKKEILDLVNIERKKAGLEPLVECCKYNDYADTRAKEISQSFQHRRLDQSPFYSGVDSYKMVGENIGEGQNSADVVMYMWMQSEKHKMNILNPNFKELSVGIVYDENSDYKYYWVQIFYTPKN